MEMNVLVIVDMERKWGNTHKRVGGWEELGEWFALAERQCTDVFS